MFSNTKDKTNQTSMIDELPYQNERLKVFLLVLALILFFITGYFRFFYQGQKKDSALMESQGNAENPNDKANDGALSRTDNLLMSEMAFSSFTGNKGQSGKSSGERVRNVIRDIFTPPVRGKNIRAMGEKTVARDRLKFQGSVVGSTNPLAMINDRFIREGETIQGYRVVSIARKRVVLVLGKETLILEIKVHE